MTDFGPVIPLDGKRPDWLTDDDHVIAFEVFVDDRPRALRLPAGHPYYAATEKGFKYWPGGEKAPADWDGEKVLLRDGGTCPGHSVTHWGTLASMPDAEIVGYRPKAPDDVVEVKPMTKAEALELWQDVTKSHDSFELDFVTALTRLGLIKPEAGITRLDRFLASTDNPTIEAALEFER